jgi:hypothetical protein
VHERGSVWDAARRWWTGRDSDGGVPVLMEDEQLPIYVVGDSFEVTCVGERVDPPSGKMGE